MKLTLLTLFALLVTITTHSQVISRFTWESGPVTQAAAGPNALSVSSSAVISANGATGNGLNPGTPKADIDLVIPGSPWFDVPGIDISISFRKEESQASFFKRGNQFDFGMEGGNLNAKFNVSNGNGGGTQVNAANVYSIPNDHAFHTYRLVYNSNTGVAVISVDGNAVYTYNGTANRVLYWNNAGNVTIGAMADATGGNLAIFDNMIIQNVPVAGPLPVKLISFTAQPESKGVAIKWTTTMEIDAKSFILERSADGIKYSTLTTVAPKGSSTATTSYSFTDLSPLSPVGYYRLKMVDIDGSATYSDIRSASFGSSGSASVSCFPNPAKDHLNIRINNSATTQYRYTLISLNGKVQETKTVTLARGQQQIMVNLQQSMPVGVYMVELENISTQTKQAFKIVKS